MKSITIRQFKNEYYPNVKKSEFAKIMNVNNSLMSKLLSGKYDCSIRSKAWLELCRYVKDNYNLQLISENKFDIEGEKATRIIRNLQCELKEKERIIKEYEEVIEELLSSTRIMVGAKEAIEKGKFKLELYRKK